MPVGLVLQFNDGAVGAVNLGDYLVIDRRPAEVWKRCGVLEETRT